MIDESKVKVQNLNITSLPVLGREVKE